MYDAAFIVHICFAVLILFGNSLVIYLYLVERGLRRKQTNRFVISLAFCDLLVAVVFIPYELFRESIQKVVTAPIDGYIASISALGSLWNLTALTYDRYIAVFDSLRYEQVMRPKRVKQVMTGIWISDIFVTLLPLSWKFFASDSINMLLLHVYRSILVVMVIVVHVILLGVYVRIFIINRHHLRFSRDRSRMFTLRKQEFTSRTKLPYLSRSLGVGFTIRKQRKCKTSKQDLTIFQSRVTMNSIVSIEGDSSTVAKFQMLTESCQKGNRNGNNGTTSNDRERKTSSSCEEKLAKLPICPDRKFYLPSLKKPECETRMKFKLRAGKALQRLSQSRAVRVELRAAKVVLILFLVNTLCWLPTVTLNVVYLISWLRKRPQVPDVLRNVSLYCFLSYSMINPWIYGILKTDYKKAMKKHLLRR